MYVINKKTSPVWFCFAANANLIVSHYSLFPNSMTSYSTSDSWSQNSTTNFSLKIKLNNTNDLPMPVSLLLRHFCACYILKCFKILKDFHK